MAMVDDPDWLLAHIRHSFITSDDTGMCELVIQDNDLLTLDEHRKRLHGGSGTQSNHKLSPDDSERDISQSMHEKTSKMPLAPSPDILSGWDFGVRRRSNTAQKLERIRKERQSRVKVKTVHWKQMPERYVNEHLDSMFKKKELQKKHAVKRENNSSTGAPHGVVTDGPSGDKMNFVNGSTSSSTSIALLQLGLNGESDNPVQKLVIASHEGFSLDLKTSDNPVTNDADKLGAEKHKVAVSALAKQLTQSVKLTYNPFKEYSKFDGRGHEGSAVTQCINMFLYIFGEPAPVKPLMVTVLVAGAKIQDLIGLTCWRYFSENTGPKLKRSDVQGYSLHISEDDGEVDYGFPALDSYEPISKFSFPTLALIEKHKPDDDDDEDGNFRTSVFVKVNDYAGFSLIQVDDLTVKMGEIMKKAIKRRKGNNYVGVYRLEYQDQPGVVIDNEQTLDSTGVMEFCMVREHSARSAHNYPEGKRKERSRKPTSDTRDVASPVRSTTVQFRGITSNS